jgi:hypothetical protein
MGNPLLYDRRWCPHWSEQQRNAQTAFNVNDMKGDEGVTRNTKHHRSIAWHERSLPRGGVRCRSLAKLARELCADACNIRAERAWKRDTLLDRTVAEALTGSKKSTSARFAQLCNTNSTCSQKKQQPDACKAMEHIRSILHHHRSNNRAMGIDVLPKQRARDSNSHNEF